MSDLSVIMVLTLKDEMIRKGIIPEDVKWDELTEKQKKDVQNFLAEKIGEQIAKKEVKIDD